MFLRYCSLNVRHAKGQISFWFRVSGVSWNSEPQNIESAGGGNDEVWNRCAQSFFKINNDRIPYFDIHYSLFDIRYSLFQSFFFDLTGRSRPAAALTLETISSNSNSLRVSSVGLPFLSHPRES